MITPSPRNLSAVERAELDRLNDAIDGAVKRRTAWLDAKMLETSPFKLGDEIYDVKTGECLGVVRRLYRYSAEHKDWLNDTSYWCDYEFSGGDNTSRQPYTHFGTKAQAAEMMRRRLADLA